MCKDYRVRYVVRNTTRYGHEKECCDVVQVFADDAKKAVLLACKKIPNGWLADLEVKQGERGNFLPLSDVVKYHV